MAELTTDQRVSALMLELLPQLAQQVSAAHTNAGALQGDSPAAAEVQRLLEGNLDAMGERVSALIEGLAAGTLKLVDEYKLVKALEDSFDADRKYIAAGANDPHYSPLRVAQLAAQNLKESGALR